MKENGLGKRRDFLKTIIGANAIGAVIGYAGGPAAAQSTSDTGDWPMYQYDSHNSGFNQDTNGPRSFPPDIDAIDLEEQNETKWVASTTQTFSTSPVISGNSVWIGTTDGVVQELSLSEGEAKRSLGFSDAVLASPAVNDNTLYYGSTDGVIYAFDLGVDELKWTVETDAEIRSAPTVANGTVYIGSSDGTIYAINATTGQELWTYETSDSIQSSPAVAESIVYIAGRRLYAVDVESGSERWTFDATTTSSPAILDGTVYVPSSGKVHAIDMVTGSEQWSFEADWNNSFSSPAVATGTVYVVDSGRKVYALSADSGDKRWEFSTVEAWSGSKKEYPNAPVVADGTVYIAARNGIIYALGADSGDEINSFATDEAIFSPAVVNDSIFITSENSAYAFKSLFGGNALILILGAIATGTTGYLTYKGGPVALEIVRQRRERKRKRKQRAAQSEITEAEETLQSVGLDSGIAASKIDQAQKAFRDGNYDTAKSHAETAVELAQRERDVLDVIETVEESIVADTPGGRQEEATERLESAIEHLRKGEFETANEDATEAKQLATPEIEYLIDRAQERVRDAQTSRKAGDYETAIEAWQRALDEYEHALERADAREETSAAVDIQDCIDTVEAHLDDTRLELLNAQTRELAAIADIGGTTPKTSDIIPLLVNEDAEVRKKTADVLAIRSKVEPRALRSHVPALLTALEDDNQVIRDQVTTCLEKLAVDYNEAAENDPTVITEHILEIVQLLTIDHPAIRKPASSALRAVATSDPEAVVSLDSSVIPELIDLLSADDSELRADVATTLAAIAQEEPGAVRDVAVHLAAHIDDKRAIKWPALRALARVDGFTALDERHVGSLETLRDLRDNEEADDELREAAQTAVRDLERYQAEQLLEPDRIDSWDDAVDDLQILLTRDDSETRRTAARAAATLTKIRSAAETGLVECLTDLLSDDLCRGSAARALANIADTEPGALSFDTLWKLTATEFDSDVRRSAAKAIATISEDEPSRVVDHSDKILSLLEDDDPALRKYALTLASVLADHSPSVIASAVPRLLDLVSSDNPTTREQAFTALLNLSETEPDRLRSGVPLFVAALDAERESIQKMASTILSRISENAATQANANTSTVTDDISDLAPLLELNDPTLCEPALEAVNEVAKEHPDAVIDTVSELIDLLDATQKNIRKTATDTLAVIADTHPDAIVEAKEALLNRFQEDATRESAIRAVAAIAQIAPDELRDETSKIAVLLNDEDTQVQLYACEALGHIGGDLALRRLREARETADYEVQVAAENTIQRIEESEDQIQTREIPRDAVESSMGAGVGDRLRTKLPDHEIIEWIGSGGNADVHKVRLTDSDEVVALKVPRWEGTLSREAADRFVDEAKTWNKLDDHEHIVDVVDWGTSPYPWLLLEYMPASLDEVSSRLSLDEKFNIIVAVADALEYAHSRGVIHLDLKPGNILLTGDDKAKVADWGLARVLLKHTHTQMGLTPPYSAPEQLTKGEGKIDRTTDIYQLGVLTFQLMTGELPFEANRPVDLQDQIFEKEPSPPSTLNPDVPREVDEVILRALSKDQTTRYEAAVLFRNALERISDLNTDTS